MLLQKLMIMYDVKMYHINYGGTILKLTMQTLLYTILIISLLVNILFIGKLLLQNKSDQRCADSDKVITSSFSDLLNDPKTLLLRAINDSSETLDIAIYNLQDQDIAGAVLCAKDRGVSIRVITDAKKAEKSKQKAILKAFANHGIEVKTNPTQKMHLKMTIVDQSLVTTGSYNYTDASAYENQEQLLTIKDHALAEVWTKNFNELWNSYYYETWDK